ncbi:MAG TPA: prepilin-type N-terminal cleavage/methylation domain-containing protein [Acidimicrobiales bacterium]|nr:prepilin-type N-terminal cleavage/methylation domain-containing protein [Acidimicrobiales bacterium]
MSSRGDRLAAPRLSDDAGFTVLELLIVMALLSVVMSLAIAGLFSINDATRSTEERSFADTKLRDVIEAMARDIRASNPIDVQTDPQPCTAPPCPEAPVSTYDSQISFEIFCTPVGGTCSTRHLRQIVYRVNGNRLEVAKGGGAYVALVAPSTTSVLPVEQRQFAIVNGPSEPVFTYLRADGTVIATSGAAAEAATRFRDCTRAVRIHLRMITAPGNPNPADLTTTVTLRNFNEVACT